LASTAGELQDGLQATMSRQQAAEGQAAHAQSPPGAIGDIDGMNKAFQPRRHPQGAAGVAAHAAHDLRGDREADHRQAPCASKTRETGESDAAIMRATVVRALWLLRDESRRLGSLMSVTRCLAQLPGPHFFLRVRSRSSSCGHRPTTRKFALRLHDQQNARADKSTSGNIFSKTGAKNRRPVELGDGSGQDPAAMASTAANLP